MSRIIYPGSFDPITNGHIDIIQRLRKIFDEVLVVVAFSTQKKSFFTPEERQKHIQDVFKNDKGVTVYTWNGLLVDFCEQQRCYLLGKGLRSIKDFEYEMDMSQTNKKLNSKVETFFLPTNPELRYISSSLVREIMTLGKDVSAFVPENVEQSCYQKKSKN